MSQFLYKLFIGLGLFQTFVLAEGDAQTAATRTISFPASQPSGAVNVPADFVGFGYDSAFLNDYDNDFTRNLINSVGSRMTAPPIIRIGGTSGDRSFFDPTSTLNRTCISGDCPNGSGATFIFGPSYFEGFKGIPNAHVTFQVPLAAKVNATNVRDYATRAYQALGADNLAAIAIGNEVAAKGHEATAADYVKAAKTVEQIVTDALNLTGNSEKIFEVLDLASNQVDNLSPWTLPDAFNEGLDNNSLAKYAAEHWYQYDGSATGTLNLQAQLMNHTAITNKFIPFGKSLSYLKTHKPSLPYVLSETGSALGGTDAYSDRFGACLWSVDFQLFAMAQGVARIDGTQRPAALHSLFVPVNGIPDNPGPSVRAPFYAQPFIADFIKSTTGVVEMGLNSDFLTAYAAYNANGLARVALVNLHEWNAGDNTQRGNQTFVLKVPTSTKNVTVGRLTAAAGAEAGGFDNGGQNITYAGQQWSYSVDNGKGHPSAASTTKVQVSNGVATVSVKDSEAVVVYVQS